MVTETKKATRVEEIQELLDDFSQRHLTPELARYVRRLWQRLARQHTYPITGGKPEIWASAVVYVIARLNFLFDRSSPQHLSADTICDFFGTKKSTVSAKAAQIEAICRIRMGEEGLCSREISDSFSFVKLPNGMIISKKMARETGILGRPQPAVTGSRRTRGWRKGKATGLPRIGDVRLYTLGVYIISGPVTKRFAKENRVVGRTIQIRGDQTLEDLHYTIFDAFDREEQHAFEFQIGGKGPMDPKARRYTLNPNQYDLVEGREPARDVQTATIDSLGLKVNDRSGYWFDFGDDWWHQINVVRIDKKAGRGRFPRVTKRTGKSPPQYVDWDEEEQ